MGLLSLVPPMLAKKPRTGSTCARLLVNLDIDVTMFILRRTSITFRYQCYGMGVGLDPWMMGDAHPNPQSRTSNLTESGR
jgi:hypothetical protein